MYTTLATRKRLAAKVFATTASYDALIADFFRRETADEDEFFPLLLTPTYERVSTLRYGENPAQRAAFYHDVMPQAGGLDQAVQLQGKGFPITISLMRMLRSLFCASFPADRCRHKACKSCGVASADELLERQKAYDAMMSLSLGASLPLIAR